MYHRSSYAIPFPCCVDQSSSFRLRFPPGFEPGPQFGVGFCWYRTSFTFDEAVTEPGCRLKLASILGKS